ncbi:MAG: multidrug effflux MFS transporter [Spirosomaceae bacterium]|nr:multidrug effflux MFS transporter [Spirosomataceae bacterium]
MRSSVSMSFMFLVSSLAVLGQFATSIYLPSLPAISQSLRTSLDNVQFTLTVFLLAYAPLQLIFGPLSDRFGRKPPLLFGLGIFLIGTVVCWFTPTIQVLIMGRILQAVGASAAVVICRAMIRDTYNGTSLTTAMAWYSVIFSLAPGIAPIIGGLLQQSLGWRSTFGATLVYGSLVTALAVFVVKESNLQKRTQTSWTEVLKLYFPVFRSRKFLIYTLCSALTMGCIYAYFAGLPDMYITRMGISPAAFGFFPLVTVTGYIISGIVTQRSVNRFAAKQLALIGFVISFVGCVFILAVPSLHILNPVTMTSAIFVFVCGSGVMFAVAIAEAVRDFPHNAGSASAMLGFLQMLGAALGSFLVSRLAHLGVLAFPVCMFGLGLLSLVVFSAFYRKL